MYLRPLILAAALTGQAYAADMPDPRVEYENTQPTYQMSGWTGGNFGIHLGAARAPGRVELGHTEGDLIALDVANGLFPRSASDPDFGFAGGVSAGYDYQTGNLVVGAALSVDFANVEAVYSQSTIDPNPNPPFAGVTTIVGHHTTIDNYGTAALRVGYAMGNTMIFASGGYATGRVENEFTLGIPDLAYTAPEWQASGWRSGYTIGGGVETKLTENLRLKFEVQYINLADTTVIGTDPINFPGQRIDYKFTNDMTVGKVGLVWGF